MPVRTFNAGRLRKADYDPASQQLDLHFDNGNVLAYKHVPQEVFRRLCSAPNAATYWEDRIAEEYPKGTPRSGPSQGGGGKSLGDLFGGDEPAQ
ncbi:KTSC domain-containing protein [Ramlibacter henchirensis]|uniref:KTSC domain-containing protein n=1 Tax=Ramlibacter henchirensis TaxID=204072 RepID=A0A4Z0BMC4_9BURK|nr:KTSC domain-containing protein [Ramlibacter henchirensis]TFY99407.1 KTSC domain-containing protein [Ramlibacter henchirensis]